jgi:integrase
MRILKKRFLSGHFFQENDPDALRDFCQIKFRTRTTIDTSDVLFTISEIQDFDEKVSSQTEYVRLTVIAHYIKWLAEQLISINKDRFTVLQIGKMEKGLKARRPVKKKRNQDSIEKSLDKNQIDLIFELFRPGSELNPFKDETIRFRNRLIFIMLYHLGLRGGELLNIRIRDIDFGKNQLVVSRRADEKDDPSKYQPLVKTLDRRLPLK